jgi:hypothetical protein
MISKNVERTVATTTRVTVFVGTTTIQKIVLVLEKKKKKKET